jgi:hypothetical protein
MKVHIEFTRGLTRSSAIDRLVKFIEFMQTVDDADSMFLNTCFRYWITDNNLAKLTEEGRRVILEEIYAKASSPDSTGGAYRSIKAVQSDKGVITVFSDPAEAPAIAGQDAYTYSRVAFFEDPDRFGLGSFIPVRGTLTRNRYRPFITPLSTAISEMGTIIFHKAARSTIQLRLPRQRT